MDIGEKSDSEDMAEFLKFATEIFAQFDHKNRYDPVFSKEMKEAGIFSKISQVRQAIDRIGLTDSQISSDISLQVQQKV